MPNVVEIIVRTKDEASRGLKEANLNAETFKKSLMGLAPAAIPALGGVAAGIGLVATSLGGAALTAGVFGKMASSVLSDASSNLAKLQQLERAAASARTASAKKAAEEQIQLLEKTWDKGYLDMIDALQTFKQKWTETSQHVAVPALTAWLHALSDGMKFLVPLTEPVAAVFKTWGETLDRYFKSSAGSAEVGRLASELGKFGAQQMKDIGTFLVDVGKAVFNLGSDLAGHNVDFGTFGKHLDEWGAAFLKWSRSAAARADVNKFLAYLRDNGGTVKTILKDLATILPNLMSGLGGAGTSDLHLIMDFFNLVAGLPPWMQKWIGEGLPLFLVGSKVLPVISAASKLVGSVQTLMNTKSTLGAEGAATGQGGKTPPGMVAGFGALGAVAGGLFVGAFIRAVGDKLSPKGSFAGNLNKQFQDDGHLWSTSLLHSFTFGGLEGWMTAKFGLPVGKFLNDLISGAKLWAGNFAKAVSGTWSTVENGAKQWGKNIGSTVSGTWSNLLNGGKQWAKNIGSTASGAWSNIENGAKLWAKQLGSSVSGAWNTAFSTTKTVAGNIVTWVTGLPAKFVAALKGLAGGLAGVAKTAFGDMLNGFKSVANGPNGILTWLGNFVTTVINKVKSILGIHSPSSVFYSIGKNMMLGLKQGIEDHAHQAADQAVGKAQAKAQASHSSGVSGAGPVGGDAATNKKLMQKMAAAYGWGSGAQWAALDTLEMHEAGYNRFARNPASGAYGIPQALPPTKMPFAAQAAGGSHAGPQIAWMLSYIKSTYGSPAHAWAQYYQHPGGVGWYAAGGPTRAGWAMVGEHGRELVKLPGGATVVPHGGTEGMVGGGMGGWAPLVKLEISSGGQSAFEQFMLKALREWVRVKGGGSVQKALGFGPG